MRNNPKPSRSYLLSRVRHNIPLYLMFLPGAIYLLVNNYIPMAGIVVAFKKYNVNDGMFGSAWCGLEHFRRFFSETFRRM